MGVTGRVRQIDGGVTIENTNYLVELKFSAEPSKVTDVDSVLSKLKGKAENTMALLIAVSGHSNGAIKAAGKGERVSVLMLDHSHIYASLRSMSFPAVVTRVYRHAAQEGHPSLAVTDFSK